MQDLGTFITTAAKDVEILLQTSLKFKVEIYHCYLRILAVRKVFVTCKRIEQNSNLN